jgi:hypothetical protein
LHCGENLELCKEAISKFLVADTNSISGSEASDFEYYLEEEVEENPQQQQQTSVQVETQAAT